MKAYNTKRKNGENINLKVYEKYVIYTPKKKPLPDIIDYIEELYKSIDSVYGRGYRFRINNYEDNSTKYKRYDYKDTDSYYKYTIVKDDGQWFVSNKDLPKAPRNSKNPFKPSVSSSFWELMDRNEHGNCILVDNKNTIVSDFGYTYDDLHQMLINNDWSHYIQNNDYIILIIDNYKYTMRFNIDTYYDYSYTNPYSNDINKLYENIPHHIDMISDEVMYNTSISQAINLWPVNNRVFDADKYTQNLIVSAGGNQDPTNQNIFYDTGITLWNAYKDKLNPQLKQYIRPKYAHMYNRVIGKTEFPYIGNDTLPCINHNNYQMANLGMLWQPRECEIFEYPIRSNVQYDAGNCIQYPSFKMNPRANKYKAAIVDTTDTKKSGSYITWSIENNSALNIIYVDEYGTPLYRGYQQLIDPNSFVGNLICFRFI